jgi:hypothetical protein
MKSNPKKLEGPCNVLWKGFALNMLHIDIKSELWTYLWLTPEWKRQGYLQWFAFTDWKEPWRWEISTDSITKMSDDSELSKKRLEFWFEMLRVCSMMGRKGQGCRTSQGFGYKRHLFTWNVTIPKDWKRTKIARLLVSTFLETNRNCVALQRLRSRTRKAKLGGS